MFEKDVGKVLSAYDELFTYCYKLKYNNTFRKNQIVLHVTCKNRIDLDNETDLKNIQHFIQDVWALKYFKQIVFDEIFETVNDYANYGWAYILMRHLKALKSICCVDHNMIVRGKK